VLEFTDSTVFAAILPHDRTNFATAKNSSDFFGEPIKNVTRLEERRLTATAIAKFYMLPKAR